MHTSSAWLTVQEQMKSVRNLGQKDRVKSDGTALRGQPKAAVPTRSLLLQKLVATGVVLCRNQDQARAPCFRLLPRLGAKCVQDTDDGCISGENTQADGCDDSNEEYGGH